MKFHYCCLNFQPPGPVCHSFSHRSTSLGSLVSFPCHSIKFSSFDKFFFVVWVVFWLGFFCVFFWGGGLVFCKGPDGGSKGNVLGGFSFLHIRLFNMSNLKLLQKHMNRKRGIQLFGLPRLHWVKRNCLEQHIKNIAKVKQMYF